MRMLATAGAVLPDLGFAVNFKPSKMMLTMLAQKFGGL